MPKHELDPEDPMELRGVGLVTPQDTSEAMTECFIEEFLRLGHEARQILGLFRNPHYTGMNMVLHHRGEDFVKAKITQVFGWWQRPVTWTGHGTTAVSPAPESPGPSPGQPPTALRQPDASAALTDPLGQPLPSLE